MFVLGLFPSLPSYSAIVSDASLYSGSLFNELLPLVFVGVGVFLAVAVILFLKHTFITIFEFLSWGRKDHTWRQFNKERNEEHKFK